MTDVSTIVVRRGNLYLDATLVEKYFSGLDSVALLERNGQSILVPLQAGAGGGLLMKVINAKGDRVIHAAEYLDFAGIDEQTELTVAVQWNREMAGLELLFADAGKH